MIVTAVIMGVALKDGQPLSDAEIRSRARELGMVEEDSLRLSDMQGSSEPETPEEGSSGSSSLVGTSTPEPAGEPGGTASPKPAGESAGTASPEPAGTASPEPAGESEGTPTPSPLETGDGQTFVTLVIRSGDSSYTVSKQLAEAGIIEDAGAFDEYLVDNGYSRKISTGTYEIPAGADMEDIAKIITKSR